MQAISLAADRFDKAVQGLKSTTIRHGRREFALGPMLLTCTNDARQRRLGTIQSVTYKSWHELDINDARDNGYDTVDTLHHHLREFYPQAQNDDTMTIIAFQIL